MDKTNGFVSTLVETFDRIQFEDEKSCFNEFFYLKEDLEDQIDRKKGEFKNVPLTTAVKKNYKKVIEFTYEKCVRYPEFFRLIYVFIANAYLQMLDKTEIRSRTSKCLDLIIKAQPKKKCYSKLIGTKKNYLDKDHRSYTYRCSFNSFHKLLEKEFFCDYYPRYDVGDCGINFISETPDEEEINRARRCFMQKRYFGTFRERLKEFEG